MKLMILNLLSACSKLILISILIQGQVIASGQEATDTALGLYTIANQHYQFDSSAVHFIVFKNGYYCKDCFTSLNDYVKTLKESYNVRFVAISMCDSSSLERKKTMAEARKLLPAFDEFVFRYNSSPGNIFSLKPNSNTPEIFILIRGNIKHIPYKQIFDFSTMNISATTRNQISTLLNEK